MARVEFTRAELADWFAARAEETQNWAQPVGMPGARSLEEIWTALREADSGYGARDDDIRGVLGVINDLAGYHGLEYVSAGRDVPNELLYVNTGNTYDATVGYDRMQHAFVITNYGDWIEHQEANDEPQEDVCVQCGEQFPVDQLEYDEDGVGATCATCREKNEPPPRWQPELYPRPLVAMLRSIDGTPIAVHYMESTSREPDDILLAFSVPMAARYDDPKDEGVFIAWRENDPYTRTWFSVIDAFKRGQPDLFVTGTGFPRTDIGIERDQFERLNVAMDEFMARGMERQAREFLATPPVLWTCAQVNEIQWIDDERGDGGGVQAFVRQKNEVGSRLEFDDLVVWSAAGDELRELIEDGFIKWGDDRTVREYLLEHGICRAK